MTDKEGNAIDDGWLCEYCDLPWEECSCHACPICDYELEWNDATHQYYCPECGTPA